MVVRLFLFFEKNFTDFRIEKTCFYKFVETGFFDTNKFYLSLFLFDRSEVSAEHKFETLIEIFKQHIFRYRHNF